MTPRKGDRVRVTYEAKYHGMVSSGEHVVTKAKRPRETYPNYYVPANATIEVIENVLEGDTYLDAAGDVYMFYDGAFRRPGHIHAYEAKRPLTLLVRDGKPVTS